MYLVITFQSTLRFAGNTRSFPKKEAKHLKGPPIGLALALPSNSKTELERVFKEKPYSFLGLVVSDEGKKFYNFDTRAASVEVIVVLTSLFIQFDETQIHKLDLFLKITFFQQQRNGLRLG